MTLCFDTCTRTQALNHGLGCLKLPSAQLLSIHPGILWCRSKLLETAAGGACKGSDGTHCLCRSFHIVEGKRGWVVLVVLPPAHNNILLGTATRC